MEFGLSPEQTARSTERRQRRIKRAQWWFGQMRQVVNRAMDWSSAPPARPEQVYFPLLERGRRKASTRLCA